MIMNYEKTKKGLPALWECGGGMTNSGNSQIICGENDERLKAIYIPKGGQLSNSNHALIPIKIGDKVIIASHQREDFTIKICFIAEINTDGTLILTTENTFSEGEWDLLQYDNNAPIQAAIEKATCYHCREPHYILNEK